MASPKLSRREPGSYLNIQHLERKPCVRQTQRFLQTVMRYSERETDHSSAEAPTLSRNVESCRSATIHIQGTLLMH
jgi:hypothetical protein